MIYEDRVHGIGRVEVGIDLAPFHLRGFLMWLVACDVLIDLSVVAIKHCVG